MTDRTECPEPRKHVGGGKCELCGCYADTPEAGFPCPGQSPGQKVERIRVMYPAVGPVLHPVYRDAVLASDYDREVARLEAKVKATENSWNLEAERREEVEAERDDYERIAASEADLADEYFVQLTMVRAIRDCLRERGDALAAAVEMWKNQFTGPDSITSWDEELAEALNKYREGTK